MSNFTVFDIETGALPDEDIERIAPPFDPDSIKVGNLGLEKAAEKLSQAKRNHLSGIRRKAALKAEYGKVLAIGWANAETTIIKVSSDEGSLLQTFWDACDEDYHARSHWVGFNCFSFDLPFLVRRSIINGIITPKGLMPQKNRYWPDFWIDLMQRWQCGDYRELISLDRFAKSLGLEGKSGSGKHFARLLKEDEAAATAYLEQDLTITRKVAEKCFRAQSI